MSSRPGFDQMQSRLLILFLILALCSGLAGYWYYDVQKRHLKQSIQDELSAIADLKVEQITAWRKERIYDANSIANNTIIATGVQRLLQNPGSSDARRDVLQWLNALKEIPYYKDIILVDRRGAVLLATSPKDSAIGSHAAALIQEVLRTQKAILSDFHKVPSHDFPHLDLVSPLIIRQGNKAVPVGAILMRLDPEEFLYPLIQSWPGSSKSAETLLIRKEGDSVLFLNELRHRTKTALSLRIPLDKKRLPAAMAIQGEQGVFEGIDYRDVPVLASTRSIAQTPWFLVAKVDIDEVYAPLRMQARLVSLVIAFLIASAGLIIMFWWRKKTAEDRGKYYESELARKALSQKYDFLSKYANDIILLCDPEGNIVEANDRATASYGYSHNELLRLNIRDIRSTETRQSITGQMQQVQEHKGMIFETVHLRKDGTAFPVEVSSRMIDSDGEMLFQSIIRDITERKQAESVFRQRNTFIETILNNLPIGLAVNTIQNAKVTYMNAKFEEIYGWPKNILMDTEQFLTHVYPDPAYRKELQDRMAADIAGGDPSRMHWEELEITTMTGKKKLVTVFNIPLFEQDMMISTVRDVTARKQSEMRLSKLNECLLSFGPDPDANINRLVALCGEQLDATCALYNRLEGDSLYALGQWNTPPDFEPRDKPEGHICFDVIKKAGQNVCVIRDLPATPYAQTDPNVVRYGLKTYVGKAVSFGGVFVGSLCVVYQIDPQLAEDELKFLQIVASAIGVEENRRGTVNALLESEDRYRRLVKSVVDYIVTIDVEDGRAVRTYHGPGCVTVTGYPSNEFQADPNLWYQMIFDEDRKTVVEQTNAVLSGALVAPFEHRIIHKDGSLHWVRHTPVTRTDTSGRVISVDSMITDITSLKLLENQLRQAQKMEAIGQLAGGIAHDFNNILTAIIGYSHLLLMNMGAGNPDLPYVEQIIASSERAAHLTHSLLTFSRKQVVDLKPVSLNDIIRRTEHLLGRVIGEDIEFKTVLAPEGLPVLADSIHIEQVLMNIAANARDAMPSGGILRIETEAITLGEDFIRTHSYGRPGSYACLSVTDTGIGMDENTKRRIFEPFFTTKEVGKGTGLGLSMVYGIIKQHRGYIDVFSEPGKGTTFKIYLPLLAAAAVEKSDTVLAKIARGTETVLLAEDDKTVRDLARYVLEGSGYRVIEAADGEEALGKFFENGRRVDLLIFDVIMPKKNGKEAYLEIKKVLPDIKTLFMSGYTADLLVKKNTIGTDVDIILKPISPADFLKKVRETLDKK